ncbi:MAG: ATP-binding protein [Gammaproteobacteria bacterium]|nr:ATP-binding protein [Gammaproteobacteria bacterium]
MEIYGEYQSIDSDQSLEQLNLSFNPSSIPLKQRWRNNGLSADFLGDYVKTFFPKDESDPTTEYKQAEIKSNVSYIANELLENSMKYSSLNSHAMISIAVYLMPEQIIIQGINEGSEQQWSNLLKIINELQENDPADLFVQRMEQDALGETSSGLGLITMINDYDADLSWKVNTMHSGDKLITTQVKISI